MAAHNRARLTFLILSLGSWFSLPAQYTPAVSVIFVTSDPAGACQVNIPMQYNTTNGKLWGCDGGTWSAISGSGGSVSITSPNSSITVGGTGSNPTLDVSTSYLNARYAQLGASNTFGAGFTQIVTPSATNPAIQVVPGSIPSNILSFPGALHFTSGGLFTFSDGTNINTVWGLPGSGTTLTAIAKGDMPCGIGTNTTGKLGVGTNTFVLTADSTQTCGFKWAAAGGSVSNYYTSTTFTGIGPTSFTPTHTLDVFDNTATTGSTTLRVTSGAGQSGAVTQWYLSTFLIGDFDTTDGFNIWNGRPIGLSTVGSHDLTKLSIYISPSGFIQTASDLVIGFNANSAFTGISGSPDTAISRAAAGIVAIGNGTAGDFSGTIKLANVNMSGSIITGGKTCTINTGTGVWTCV